MIFFSNAEGTINAVVSSPVYQGSNYANEVVFVAPFVPVSVVTVSFIKPNGGYTPAALMTVKELTGIKDEKGNAFNAWTYLVPEAYTEYSGILTAQFKVTNGNSVLATASSSFNVQKGVPNVTPEPPEDIYQQILSALSELKQDVENLENGTTEVGKAKEAEKAEQAEYYTTSSGDKSVNTIETQFSNKLDKQTGVPSYPQVYAVEGNTQQLIPVSNGSTIAPNDRIAQYTSSGTLFTQPPEVDTDAANKGYVDNAIQEAVADKEHFRGYLSTEEIKALKNPTEGDYAWSSDTRTVWSYNGTEWIDTQVPVPDQTVPKGTSIPLPDAATGSAGKATSYAAIDHIHPPSSEYPSKEEFDVSLITHTKNGAAVGDVDTLAGAKAEVSVESENLIPFPYARSGNTQGGVTWTVADDGIITATGTATESSGLVIFVASETAPIPVNGQYTLSLNKQGEGANAIFAELEKDGAYQGGYYNDTTFSYQNNNITVIRILASAGYTYNCTIKPKFQVGTVATAYTPYLPAGTAVEVQACGKNLANENTLITSKEYERTYFQGRECLKFKGTEFKPLTLNFPERLNVVGVNWALDSDTPNKEISFLRLVYTNFSNESKTTYVGQGNVEINNWVDAAKTASPTLFDNLKSLTVSGTGNLGTGTFYVQIMANLGDELTPYTPYIGAVYQSEVGQTIEVEQYDRITNIFTNTAGASVTVQFKISTQLYLNRFGLIEEGLFANRPTNISEQSRVYIATDRFDNSRYTYLEGGVDGSVTENWTEIVNYGQDSLQTQAKELVPAINEVNTTAETALLNIPKSAEETGAFISGDNTLAGAKVAVEVGSKNLFDENGVTSTEGATFTELTAEQIKVTATTEIPAGNAGYAGVAQKNIKAGQTVTINASWSTSAPANTGRIAIYWRTANILIGQQLYSNTPLTVTIPNSTNENDIVYFYFYVATGGGSAAVGDEVTYTNITVNLGDKDLGFSTPVSEGTAVEVTACGKNLLNPATFQNGQEYIGVTLTNNQDGTITLNGTAAATSYFSIFNTNADAHTSIPEYLKGKRITLSLETNGNNLNDCTFVTWAGETANFNDSFSETKILSTTIQPDTTDWSIRISLNSGQTYDNIIYKIMVTLGEYAGSLYIPYEGLTYSATVGETIEVEQYDRVTNIISNTTGAAVSTQFLQSTRYELDTKPVSLAGTYAERPTGTYPYVVLYTATDTGRTYRLEYDTKGSVSGNWVNISSAGGTGGGFTPRGEWNSATTYNENDLVSLNGSSYICIGENTNATPASNPDKWMVNAEKGATGTTGKPGTNGLDALMQITAIKGVTINSSDITILGKQLFNRDAEIGETCPLFATKVLDDETMYYFWLEITDKSSEVFYFKVIKELPLKGDKGATGATGPQGPAGANGTDATIESLNLTGVTAVTTGSPGYKMTCPLEVNGELRMTAMNIPLPIQAGTYITLTQGANSIQINNSIKLYRHNITISQSGVMTMLLTLINRSSVKLARVDELNSQLTTLISYSATGWYRESSSNVCSGVAVVATTGGGITCVFVGNNGTENVQFEPDETITDSIDIII